MFSHCTAEFIYVTDTGKKKFNKVIKQKEQRSEMHSRYKSLISQ